MFVRSGKRNMRRDSKLVRTLLNIQLIITIITKERWRDVARKAQSPVKYMFPSLGHFPVTSNAPPRPPRSLY